MEFTTREILNFLVDEVVEFEGLDDIGLELRLQERGLDLLEEELADRALELGCDFLRFHRDVHLGDGGLAVRFLRAGKQAAEGCLSRPVLAHHDDDFGICEFTRFDFEMESSEGLLHCRILVALISVGGEVVACLGDTESQGFVAEAKILRRDVPVKEDVDPFADRLGERNDTVNCRFAIEHTDEVGKIVKDRQIMLDNNDIVIWTKKVANRSCCVQSLLDIEVR